MIASTQRLLHWAGLILVVLLTPMRAQADSESPVIITVGGIGYEIGVLFGEYNVIDTSVLKNQPWWGSRSTALEFADAFSANELSPMFVYSHFAWGEYVGEAGIIDTAYTYKYVTGGSETQPSGAYASQSVRYMIAIQRPVVSVVVSDTVLTAGETSLVTFTFTEAVTDFSNDDLSIANGTLSTVTSDDDGTTWTATLTPTAANMDATNVITVDMTGVQNIGGNAGSGTTDSNNYEIVIVPPTVSSVSSSTADGSYTAGDIISIQVTFSEAVDVTGTPELLLETGDTDRSATYATGTGSASLTFTYTVQAGDTAADLDYAATDALSLNGGTIKSVADATDALLTLSTPGQTGSIGQAKAIVIDTTPPSGDTVAFDQDPINDSNDAAASFTFGGAEVGTDYSYTISSSGGGTPVTNSGTIATTTDQITGIDVSGLTDGTLTLSVTLTDGAGNAGSAATDTAEKDATLPSGHSVAFVQSAVNDGNTSAIGFSFAAAEVGTSYSYTISSSGGGTPVTNNGTITTATDQITGIDVSGLTDGTLTLSVTLTDAAGNVASAATDTATKDVNAPASPSTPILSDSTNTGSTADTLTNAATPTITGTAEVDATVEVFVDATSAGTTSADGSGDWSFTFTAGALASGANSVTATATDAAGNVSAASSAIVIAIDADAPTLVITGPTDVVTEAFTATFTFSEAVSDFIADDITVTNGTKGTFAGSGSTYTLVITPVLGTTVSVSVAAGLATDPAGNGNDAANTLQVTAGSPASEFARNESDIQQVILQEATRSLQSTVAANQRMIREARGRFIAGRRQEGDSSEEGDVPFDVNGSLDANGVSVSSKGTFYARRVWAMEPGV